MKRRRSGLRLTAVLTLVVLALTGFSTGSSGGSGKSGSGKSGSGKSGGGCSSSGQDHDDTDDTSNGTGRSSGGTSQTLRDAKVSLVSCATEADEYATVKIANPNARGAYFTVTVTFLAADSRQVDLRTVDEFVAANATREARIPLSHSGLAADVEHCEPERYAPAD